MNEIMTAVKEALAGYLSLEAGSIRENDALYEGLGVDSSGIVTLLLDLEQRCGVEFDMEALQPEHLATVQSLANWIHAIRTGEEEREEG